MQTVKTNKQKDTHKLEITQTELDLIYIVFGHVVGKNSTAILDKIQDLVSEDFYEKFDLLEFSLNSCSQEVDLCLSVKGLK